MKNKSILAFGLPFLTIIVVSSHLLSCGSSATSSAKFNVGGTISGLSGTLVLANQNSKIALTENGPFSFAVEVKNEEKYNIVVDSQPDNQTCSVSGGIGVITNDDITGVEVSCTTDTDTDTDTDTGNPATFSVGGTLAGSEGTVVLQNNAANNLSLTSNGIFSFGDQLTAGEKYAVTVLSAPQNQTCSVLNGTGTVSAVNIDNISVKCLTAGPVTYEVGGTVTGIVGTLTLQNNLGNDLTVPLDGSFKFTTEIADGESYSVTVKEHPRAKYCTVTNGAGSVATADVTSISISCTTLWKMFVSTPVLGDLGGSTGTPVSRADAVCSNDSQSGSGTYKALFTHSTDRRACTTANCGGGISEHFDWVFQANTVYGSLTDGVVISTTDSNGLLPFPLTNKFTAPSKAFWTGMESDWTTDTADNCTNWTATDNSVRASRGSTTFDTTGFISFTTSACSVSFGILCVEQ